jgi:hypothetical protein
MLGMAERGYDREGWICEGPLCYGETKNRTFVWWLDRAESRPSASHTRRTFGSIFPVTTTVIARRIQADGTGSTSMDLLASRISMVDVSETHEIGFNLVRMKVLSASTSSTRMRRM